MPYVNIKESTIVNGVAKQIGAVQDIATAKVFKFGVRIFIKQLAEFIATKAGINLKTATTIKANIGRKIFIHINTTNPVLLENSEERKIVNNCGWEVAYDNMEVEL